MDPLLTLLFTGVVAAVIGIAIGWKFARRFYRRSLIDMEHETGARSLELLETRQHLKKISGHLKTSLKKDKLIRQLRRKQKKLLREIDQHVLQARRQEKAHFIQTAKIKLELIEARMQNGGLDGMEAQGINRAGNPDPAQTNGGTIGDNKLTQGATYSSASNGESLADFGQLNSELQSLLKQAGIRRVRQLANLSKQDIEQLARQSDRQTAD